MGHGSAEDPHLPLRAEVRTVNLEPEAEQELAAAYEWYESKLDGLGEELLSEVDSAIERISRSPGVFPLVHGPARAQHVRRALLRRFPLTVVFIEAGDAVRVLAFAHQRRRPGYWRQRFKRR